MTSPSREVAIMCGVARMDIRTITGANIDLIRRKKLEKQVNNVPEEDLWRMKYMGRLLSERGEAYYKSEEEEVLRLSGLINSLCVN